MLEGVVERMECWRGGGMLENRCVEREKKSVERGRGVLKEERGG